MPQRNVSELLDVQKKGTLPPPIQIYYAMIAYLFTAVIKKRLKRK
jgi:hypothetical protein